MSAVAARGEPEAVEIVGADGWRLGGHHWPAAGGRAEAIVLINPATGVLARYYHRYARFLADNGFDAVTYDYRGIGASRPAHLRGCAVRWRDWGERDFEAAARWALQRHDRVRVVGHSIGGFLPGYAESAPRVERYLTIGAQYAYWPDYAAGHRLAYLAKWHLAMPAITAALGYFPGRRLGWLEDLPAGVALEWSRRGSRFETSYPRGERAEILQRFAAVRSPILAVAMTDDAFATPSAVRRALSYYTGAPRSEVYLPPGRLGFRRVGHFGLFHDRHLGHFWPATLDWLREGANPWAGAAA